MSAIPPSVASLRGAVDLSSLVRPAPGTAGAPGSPGSPAAPNSSGSAPSGGATGGAQGGAVEVPSLDMVGSDTNFSSILELSSSVPMIVVLWSEQSASSKQTSDEIATVVSGYGGRLLLVRVDVDSNPQLAGAFQAQAVPTVAAIVGGRPVPLFTGTLPEHEVREVFEQVLQLSAQNGVSGTAVVSGNPAEPAEPVEAPLPPHHAEAYAAIERGDFDAAATSYRTAIAQNPRDDMAVAGLAQVNLLGRLQGTDADEVRAAAAADSTDTDAQLLVADLDLSGGHVDDAFDRLLALYPGLDVDGKGLVRARIVELFEVVGATDPRVVSARRRLAGLLY